MAVTQDNDVDSPIARRRGIADVVLEALDLVAPVFADATEDTFDFRLPAGRDRTAPGDVLHSGELHVGIALKLALDLWLALHSLADRQFPVGRQDRHLTFDHRT